MIGEPERRRHKALAGVTRARILAELAHEDGLGISDLARRLGLHVNTVRAHLRDLAESGLVACAVGSTRRRGRPPFTYRIAGEESVAARRYQLLARMLQELGAVLGSGGNSRLVEVGEEWGHHLVEAPRFGERSEQEAVRSLLAVLDEIGFSASLEPSGRHGRVAMRDCPFRELAREHSDIVCPLHLGVMRGVLDELGSGTTVARLEPFAREDTCFARLAARPGPGGVQRSPAPTD